MQLASTPAGSIPLRSPLDSRPGMPTTDSVVAAFTHSSTRFPGRGIGLGAWLLPAASYEAALQGAQALSASREETLGVLRYGLDRFAVTPLVQLTWVAGGYGGHFRTSTLHPYGRDVWAIRGKASELVAAFERGRSLNVQPG